MKRVLNFRLLLTATATLMIAGGLFAQSTDVPGTAANYASGATQPATYIMEGTTVPVYASPDPYFHPGYDPDVANSLTAGFTWTWTEGTATLSFSQNDAEDNYVEVTAPAGSAAGSPYTVSVTENAPAGLGGCSGAATNLTINVVAQPDITIGGDATYSFCVGNPGFPGNIQSTITGGWQNYRAVWTLEIATLNTLGVKTQYYDDENGTNPAGAQKYAVEYTTAAPQAIANAAAAPNLITVSAFNTIDPDGAGPLSDATTVYTYVLTSINDQASRFGDFITLGGGAPAANAFTYYSAGPETVVVTVYPAPTTGPIFHIDASWAN